MAEDLVISRLGREGDGMAFIGDGTVAVPFTLAGEQVVAERDGRTARLLSILAASPDRAEPFCPVFTRCGGCRFQHLGANAYDPWKRDRLVAALTEHRLDAVPEPLVDAHGAGRRRVVLHVRRVAGTVAAGFMASGSHDLVPIDRCPITVPALARAPAVATALAATLRSDKPLDVAVTATEGGLDVDLRGSGPPSAGRRQALVEAADALDLARLSVHGDVVVERRPPLVIMGRAAVLPPPGGFLQATARGEEVLAGLVLGALGSAGRVADLFSGVGPFALRMAERAEVHAVDGGAPMLAALDRAARRTPGLRRVTTETRDLFRRPLLPPEFERVDAVVLDPPRQGAEAQVRQLIPSSCDRVILVSCDPGTFARDAAILAGGGFAAERVVPVDQFKWSPHLEVVGVFGRVRARTPAGRRRRRP